MIVKGYRIVCDQCGGASDWIEHTGEPVVPEETKEWLSIDLESRTDVLHNFKNYCSKDCVKDAVDKL